MDFKLPQKWIDPKNSAHVMLVAIALQEIRYGTQTRDCPPEIRKDGSVEFPLTNDYWLFPPNSNVGQPAGHWRLVGRYATETELLGLMDQLKLWCPNGPK